MNPFDRVADWSDDLNPKPTGASDTASGSSSDFDVQAFFNRHGLKVRRRGEWNGGEKWELEVCPINPDHIGGCAIITRGSNGALGFKCHHNSCSGIGWIELRELLEPGYRKSDSISSESPHLDGWPSIVPFTDLAESGAGDETIRDIAGHVSKRMLKHYSHIRMEAKRDALESILSKPDPKARMVARAAESVRPSDTQSVSILN